jgi:hypothetical protein
MSSEQTYIPGTCNIGPNEIKRRRQAAYFGLILTIIVAVILLTTHVSHLVRLAIVIPAMIFATGLVQSSKKFCLAFGLAGIFNFGQLGSTNSVESAADRKADRRTALGILMQSFVIALLLTAIFELIPS